MSERLLSWRQIAEAPKGPGVYAWYYGIVLSDYDLDALIAQISDLKDNGSEHDARKAITEYLDKFVLRYFQEEDYEVRIRGPLKPSYGGQISHQASTSQELIARILESPERLRTVKRVFETSIPRFASPIYIGMAGDLRTRLLTHKRLIHTYREGKNTTAGTRNDQNFARRVVARGMRPSRLSVAVAPVAAHEDEYVDAENLLNRINYPILGRN